MKLMDNLNIYYKYYNFYENVYELFLILKDVYEDDEYIYGVKLSDKNNDYYELLKIDNDLDFSDVSISVL